MLAEDALFATLDPTTRRIELQSGKQALLTDTVSIAGTVLLSSLTVSRVCKQAKECKCTKIPNGSAHQTVPVFESPAGPAILLQHLKSSTATTPLFCSSGSSLVCQMHGFLDNFPFLPRLQVGFIQKLPTQLVAAFRATLEELGESSLLLHVVDVSSPNAAAQTDTVNSILKELSIELPTVTVWNKVCLNSHQTQ